MEVAQQRAGYHAFLLRAHGLHNMGHRGFTAPRLRHCCCERLVGLDRFAALVPTSTNAASAPGHPCALSTMVVVVAAVSARTHVKAVDVGVAPALPPGSSPDGSVNLRQVQRGPPERVDRSWNVPAVRKFDVTP
ncbi:hypothetical protein HPB50_020435 [Hyalomma asiaticum]|uniref:Uncharacterized protein n=1 Tax=Hyalomma asiaticum TaxID=266040 RepID=A0ACB7T0N7_HYAAI|nr:hypothetical protein HPB50_020435 [Hyalomma asiaticum]